MRPPTATLEVPVEVIRALELPTSILSGSRAVAINLADYFRILERLSISAHDETWGLSERPLLPGATGLVLSSITTCTTLLEAAKAIARTYNLLHGGAYNRVELHDDRLTYIIDDRGFPY